jgi:membrane associated rhomboid family serine protease
MATCYRHPNRETGVSCSNCGNPICPDCMTPTPVGMRCPDCSKQRTQTRSLQSLAVEPIVTYVLIALNVLIFIGARSVEWPYEQFVLFGNGVYRSSTGGIVDGVAEGSYWRLLTSGFLHTEIWHIGLNMLALFWLGRMIEPALGHLRYAGIYFTSLLTGSLVVMLMQPDANTLGASGAVYGLLGAAIVMARNRNIDLVQSGLLPILGLNFVVTLVFGFSLAAHVGGLLGGLLVTYVIEELDRRRGNTTVPAVAFCVLVSAAAIAGSIFAASG